MKLDDRKAFDRLSVGVVATAAVATLPEARAEPTLAIVARNNCCIISWREPAGSHKAGRSKHPAVARRMPMRFELRRRSRAMSR